MSLFESKTGLKTDANATFYRVLLRAFIIIFISSYVSATYSNEVLQENHNSGILPTPSAKNGLLIRVFDSKTNADTTPEVSQLADTRIYKQIIGFLRCKKNEHKQRTYKQAFCAQRVLPEPFCINISKRARAGYFWGAKSGVAVRAKYDGHGADGFGGGALMIFENEIIGIIDFLLYFSVQARAVRPVIIFPSELRPQGDAGVL